MRYLALTLTLIFAFALAFPAKAQTPQADSLALAAFYNNTGGTNWTNNTGWLTEPVADWYGVRLNADGRVTRLDISYNNLTGSIPSELGGLSQLTVLYLFDNNLTGTIPSELGDLSQLESLGLAGNELTGTIPSELGDLSKLQGLHLNNNNLTGTIPSELGGLSQLENLALTANNLTGTIPSELGGLSKLESLYLHGNNLTGTIPSELGDLSQLVYLYLDTNYLTGTIPSELGGLSKLEKLWLGFNKLTGTIPSELGGLSQLQELYLYNNNLTGPMPLEIANLPNLENLSLPSGVCVPDDLVEWAIERYFSIFPCNVNDRLLPLSLLREDGNGLSLALPTHLQNPSSVTILDASVASVSVADGWLTITPRGQGTTEIEVVPPGGGDAWLAGVEVRAAVGTFGIDILMERPAPVAYAKALTEDADWWSSTLDGTEWPDRVPTCFTDKATALADELLIHANVFEYKGGARGVADVCFREDGNQAALDPGGGHIIVASFVAGTTGYTIRHEIGHLLGLVLWRPETGLTTADRAYSLVPAQSRHSVRLEAIPPCPECQSITMEIIGHWSKHQILAEEISWVLLAGEIQGSLSLRWRTQAIRSLILLAFLRRS